MKEEKLLAHVCRLRSMHVFPWKCRVSPGFENLLVDQNVFVSDKRVESKGLFFREPMDLVVDDPSAHWNYLAAGTVCHGPAQAPAISRFFSCPAKFRVSDCRLFQSSRHSQLHDQSDGTVCKKMSCAAKKKCRKNVNW